MLRELEPLVAQELFLYTMSLPANMDINNRKSLDESMMRLTAMSTLHDSRTSLKEIERLEALEGAEINDAKIRLANEVTTLLHGAEAAAAAGRDPAEARANWRITREVYVAGQRVAAGAGQDGQGELGADAGDLKQLAEQRAFARTDEAIEGLVVLTDLEMGEQREGFAPRGKAVEHAGGDLDLVADAVHVQHHVRRVHLEQ